MKKINLTKIKSILRDKIDKFIESVQPLYVQLDWTWAGSNVPPTTEEIKKCLKNLIVGLDGRMVKYGDGFEGEKHETGGLVVGYIIDKDNGVIEFIMEFKHDPVFSCLPLSDVRY